MIKSELIEAVAARNPHLYRQDAEKIVETILESIVEALERGERVEIRGFGAFQVRYRPSRAGRDPSNGNAVFVEEKWVPLFRPGKAISDRLNEPRRD
ncbi:integration host factor subunit beta [Rhizobium sp. BG4]|uniref:integration host factor subunit beta n=1 Tax=Rhizobium sp. BG4 TaxID=2613770 RepID=UPI00193E218F|nr:integration host factor subunit beta [Rhizobium sp. BG4]QRM47278.1 integration host factor subunit beta [Rhizobium sp. BG4]